MIPLVSREAELELTDAARHYAENAGKDLGLALIEEFEAGLQLLCEQPQLGAPWRNRRRLPLRRFPFSIIYYTSGDSLRVIALAHHRRKPQYWSGRS
jgi:plasmid stabilization system protein ParE